MFVSIGMPEQESNEITPAACVTCAIQFSSWIELTNIWVDMTFSKKNSTYANVNIIILKTSMLIENMAALLHTVCLKVLIDIF